MKDNTYIIPAVDFYIGISNFSTADFILKELKDGKTKLIPFECVDGLLVEDLGFLFSEKGFIVFAINKLKLDNKSGFANNILDMVILKKKI